MLETTATASSFGLRWRFLQVFADQVFVQILIESVVIAVLGGIAGMITSYALVQFIAVLAPTENTPIVTATALIIAFSFSVLIGILAGLIPAFKASRLNPIQALRYD